MKFGRSIDRSIVFYNCLLLRNLTTYKLTYIHSFGNSFPSFPSPESYTPHPTIFNLSETFILKFIKVDRKSDKMYAQSSHPLLTEHFFFQ